MTPPDGTRRDRGSRPGSYPSGSKRPRQAPRPVRPSSPESSTICLCPATFVELTGDQQRQAIEALAELLVPLLTTPVRRPSDPVGDPGADPVMAVDVAPIGDT
ncbi:MAG: hypothetical protein ACYCYD_13840 [Acidimicrobiales bacterium]